jgi:hypothetical protein
MRSARELTVKSQEFLILTSAGDNRFFSGCVSDAANNTLLLAAMLSIILMWTYAQVSCNAGKQIRGNLSVSDSMQCTYIVLGSFMKESTLFVMLSESMTLPSIYNNAEYFVLQF